eukprot:jgi/Botrbrau1/101/Bobra.0022s0090.1
MCAAFERGGLFHAKKRLFSSQSSQQSGSNFITTALGNCNLASEQTEDGDVMMSLTQDAAGTDILPLSSLPSGTAQELSLVSQDFNTPAEQQYNNEVNPEQTGRHMHSPALISPGHCKRSRRLTGTLLERQDSTQSDCSSSQKRRPGVMQPPRQQIHKKARVRSPPVARNIFIDGPEDPEPAILGPPALPVVSRFRSEFKEIERLKGGNYSKVFRVRCRFDGGEYIVKRSKHPVTDLAARRQCQQEAMAMLAAGEHPCIVRYFSSWVEEESDGGHHFYILMERCLESVDTKRKLRGGPFTEGELVELLRQVAEALQHLHAKGIIHNDVKPDNMYCTANGGVKLGDFGLACLRAGGHTVGTSEGDARYLAPEVLRGNRDNLEKADIFSLGASLYELALGKELPSGGTVYADIRNGKLKLLPGLSAQFQNMLKSLMASSPADRPTATKILSSSVLAKRATTSYAELPFVVVR